MHHENKMEKLIIYKPEIKTLMITLVYSLIMLIAEY